MPWYEAIDQPGAEHMMLGRLLLESRPLMSRIPDKLVIVPDRITSAVPGNGSYRYVAIRDQDGSYAMAYVSVGRKFSVRMYAIKGNEVVACWFNPRNCESKEIGKYSYNNII